MSSAAYNFGQVHFDPGQEENHLVLVHRQIEKIHISTCLIFSNVVATLSDTFLDQLIGNKREVLQDIIQTENVTLLVDSEAVCTLYSLSGLLNDVISCHQKLAGLIKVESEEEHIKDEVAKDEDKLRLQENIKPHRKRRKLHKIQFEDTFEVKHELGIDKIITKRGRVVKRPSKLANTFVQLDKNLGSEGDCAQRSSLNEQLNQNDASDFEHEMENDSEENGTNKKKDENEATEAEVTCQNKIDKKQAKKVVNLAAFKKEQGDKDFKEMKKKIRQHYENRMPFRYFCDQCSFKSKRESHYNKHLKLHNDNPNLKLISCPLCDFTCIRQSLLKKHQICHELDILTCGVCNFKTKSVKQLGQHMTNKHLKKNDESNAIIHPDVMKCCQCDFTTYDKTAFLRHSKTHLMDKKVEPDPLYSCNLCSYSTRKRVLFDRHKKHVHSNTRPFLCDLCGAAFKRTDTLAAHKMTHVDVSKRVLPFKCAKCPKAFKSGAHLRSHMYVHSNVKAFQCHICGQLFKTKQVQQKHIMNIHSNPRSFKCGTCQKDFNTKYTLQRHEKTHESDLSDIKIDLGLYEQPLLKPGDTGDKILKDDSKFRQLEKVSDSNQAIVVEFSHGFNEDAEASIVLNEVQDSENIVGKEGLVQQVDTADENMSAIQHITLNEISQHFDNGADHFQPANDIGTIYIEGLDSVMSESGAINIVNLDGQNIQQILIPRGGFSQGSVNLGQFISQINPSTMTAQSVLKGGNSDDLGEVFVSAESLEKGDNSEGLGEVYVSTVHLKDNNPTYVNATDISKVYVETNDNYKEVKQVVVPSNFVTSTTEKGEMLIIQDKEGANQNS